MRPGAETRSSLNRTSTPRRGRCGGAEGIRASSPACKTWMSEQVGADLPEARDGEGS